MRGRGDEQNDYSSLRVEDEEMRGRGDDTTRMLRKVVMVMVVYTRVLKMVQWR